MTNENSNIFKIFLIIVQEIYIIYIGILFSTSYMKTEGPSTSRLDTTAKNEILSELESIVKQADYQELKNDFS